MPLEFSIAALQISMEHMQEVPCHANLRGSHVLACAKTSVGQSYIHNPYWNAIAEGTNFITQGLRIAFEPRLKPEIAGVRFLTKSLTCG